MCSTDGSVSRACDDETGICVCKESYTDNKCDRCKSGNYGYPDCEGRLHLKSPTFGQREKVIYQNW